MNEEQRVLIYCRESRDENSEYYDRIETQRDILVNFCKREGYTNIVEIVMDDNVSGTKFDRLDKIKDKIKKNELDVIVFKDMSRLGRNQLECLEFMAFVDKYDVEVLFESGKLDDAFIGLQAWFNEQRAGEDSRKVRRVFEHKMTHGELPTRPVYGYKKVDDKFIVNEEQAEVVRRIFDLFINGTGTHAIATILNFEKIPTPSQANRQNRICYAWNKQHIHRILNDESYTGKKVYHKRTRKSYKSKKIIPVKKEKWIIAENHHEPIITQEIYDKAQAQKKDCILTNYRGVKTALFAGLLYCGRCGSTMLRITRKGRNTAYICSKNRYEGAIKNDIRPNYGCDTHHLIEKEITVHALNYIKSLMNDNEKMQETYYNKIIRKYQSNENKENRIDFLQKEINDIDRKIEQIYDDKLNGFIPQNLYLKKYNEFNDKLIGLKDEIDKLKETSPHKKNKMDINEFKNIVATGKLNNFTLKQIFEKIIIFEPNEISEKNKLKLDIPDDWFDDISKNGGIIFIDNVYESIGYISNKAVS